MAKPDNAQLAKDHLIGKSTGASRLHPMAPGEEFAYAVRHMIVDRSVCHQPGPVAEVPRPSSQYPIEPVPYFLPGSNIVGPKQISHFLVDSQPLFFDGLAPRYQLPSFR